MPPTLPHTTSLPENLKTRFLRSKWGELISAHTLSISPKQARQEIRDILEGDWLKLDDLRRIKRLIEASGIELSRQQAHMFFAHLNPEGNWGSHKERRPIWQDLLNVYSPFGFGKAEGQRHFRARVLRIVLEHGPADPDTPQEVMQQLCKMRGKLPASTKSNMILVQNLWCDTLSHRAADYNTWELFMKELFDNHPAPKQRSSLQWSMRSDSTINFPEANRPYHPYLTKAWNELATNDGFTESSEMIKELEELAAAPEHGELVKKIFDSTLKQESESPAREERLMRILIRVNPSIALDIFEREANHREWMDPELVAPLLTHADREIRERAMRISVQIDEISSCAPQRESPNPKPSIQPPSASDNQSPTRQTLRQ